MPVETESTAASARPTSRRGSTRRAVVALAGGLTSLAGRAGGFGPTGAPGARSFDFVLTDDGESLGTNADSTDVGDSVTLSVGSEVTLRVASDLDSAVGVHNHVTGATFTVDPAVRPRDGSHPATTRSDATR